MLEKKYQVEFRHLFPHCINDYFPRLVIQFRLPLDVAAYRNQMMDEAASSEVSALVCVAHAKFGTMVAGKSVERDQISVVIYARITQKLRKKLDDFYDSDVNDLLPFVIAMLNFDIFWKRLDTLPTHRDGFKHLISARGGT